MTTPSPSVLLDLAERCERATGPDRELDALIFRAIGMPLPDKFLDYPVALTWDEAQSCFMMPVLTDMQVRFEHPAYTASIDAAMTLVPKGYSAKLFAHPEENHADIYLLSEYEPSAHPTVGGRRVLAGPFEAEQCRTLPLALCAAALRARSTDTVQGE